MIYNDALVPHLLAVFSDCEAGSRDLHGASFRTLFLKGANPLMFRDAKVILSETKQNK
jgi:hypothetical protein